MATQEFQTLNGYVVKDGTARTNANNATTLANEAKSSAGTATTLANSAQTTADNALSIAQTANGTANTALNKSNEALAKNIESSYDSETEALTIALV